LSKICFIAIDQSCLKLKLMNAESISKNLFLGLCVYVLHLGSEE